MKRIYYLFSTGKWQKPAILFSFFMFYIYIVNAQPCTISTPVLFGTPVDKIVCRGSDAQLGVNSSEESQQYSFYVNNGASRKIGGPLVGNGDQLSVDASIVSASSVGQYYVVTTQGTCTATNPGFYVYYGNIDNLNITNWSANSVSFSWASSGRFSYVKYEYAVSTVSNPDLLPDEDTSTTYNTSATVDISGKPSGVPLYIHVRVFAAYKQAYGAGSPPIVVENECNFTGGDYNFDLSWTTINFNKCAISVPIGGINTGQTFVCTGSSTTLTGTGGNSYLWFKDGVNTGITTSTYIATTEGEYSLEVTTSAGCVVRPYSRYINERIVVAGEFPVGGGTYCRGQQVKLGLIKTNINQTYDIKRNGVTVATLQGIGTNKSHPDPPQEDTIWHVFNITSPTEAGTYTITTNYLPCASVDFGSQVVSLAAYGNITPAFAEICTGQTVQLTVSGGTSYKWFKDGTELPGQASATYTANSGGTYSATINSGTCLDIPAVNNAIVTSSSLPAGTAEWTGAADTDWNNAGNWKCMQIPGTTTEVVINGGLPNYPAILSDVTIKKLTLNTGATLNVNPGVKLTVTSH